MPTSNHESASTTHRNNIFAYLFGRLLYLFVGHRLAWSVLAISNGIAIAFWYISITERSHAVHVRFVRESQEVQWAIESRLFRYRVAVRATTAFFESVDSVSGAQWKSFTSLLNVQELLPELEALGFAPRVPHEALTSYMDGVRATTHARYNVFPTNRDDVAFPVLFVEPLTLENRNIIGFDMSSTPLRRKAMVEAHVTGLPAATPGTSLFEDIGKPNVGFSLFGPVYSRQSRIRLPSTSSDSLIGYTFASFRFNELMRGVLLEPGTRGVHFAIFDAGDRGICLYDSDTAMLSDSDETRPELALTFASNSVGRSGWCVLPQDPRLLRPLELPYPQYSSYAPCSPSEIRAQTSEAGHWT